MDLQHKMLRSTIDILINKSIIDIQNDTKRSIRNFVDLGVHFAKGANQKRFFKLLQSSIQDPKSPYNRLVVDMIKHVNTETIKTLGTNLGCSSFTYGVNTIRQKETVLDCHIPWLIIFDWDMEQTDELSFEAIDALIEQGTEYGIYSFVFHCCDSLDRVKDTIELAKRHSECSFFLLVCPQLIDDLFINLTSEVHNIIISVCVSHETIPACEAAFEQLHDHQIFYGFHTYYNKNTKEHILSNEFIDHMISKNCYFGGYINREKKDLRQSNELYQFICNTRKYSEKPILVFDWDSDTRYISNIISKGSGLMRISKDGRASLRNSDEWLEIGNHTMENIITTVMPKIKRD